jgi:hypothetical protein
MLPRGVRDWLLGIIAVAVLVAFGFVYGIVFYYAIGYAISPTTEDADAFLRTLNDSELLTIAAGLTGLVGGIVAVALSPDSNDEAAESVLPITTTGWLALLYTGLYALLGLGAVIVWVFVAAQGVDTPNIIQALASVALGLFIPIVRTYFIPSG